jgi:starch synthase
MRILFVSSELAPLAQSGGLGDAVSGLARALGALGHEVTCIIPGYRTALRAPGCPRLVDDGGMRLTFPGFELHGRIWSGDLFPGVEIELVDIPALYDRPGLYGDGIRDYPDNALRFIALARAAAYRAESQVPDVVVAHDWQAALVCALLRTTLDRAHVRGVGCVQAVHNNAHQGRFPAEAMALTGLPADLFHAAGVEAWGSLCLLKGGVMWADRVVAVSPTYARQIQTPAFGEGLEGAYRSRAHRLTGIVNGIDTQRFDPETDRALAAQYDVDSLDGKAKCRQSLVDHFRLDPAPPGLLLGAIGRLAAQKGWDVLAQATDALVDVGARLVFLGDGDPELAAALARLTKAHPRRVAFHHGYDEALSRQVYAGADALLVPSRFEPCGLVQLVAQRYGTIPIAHATGGLVDTIHDPWFLPVRTGTDNHDPWRRATGVLFAPLTTESLVFAVERLKKLGEGERLRDVQRRLLGLDVSWEGPAQTWLSLLHEVVVESKKRL